MDNIYLIPKMKLDNEKKLEIELSFNNPSIPFSNLKSWEKIGNKKHFEGVIKKIKDNEYPVIIADPSDDSTWLRMGAGQINIYDFFNKQRNLILPRYDSTHPKHPNKVTLSAGYTESFAEILDPNIRAITEGFEEAVCIFDNKYILLPHNQPQAIESVLASVKINDLDISKLEPIYVDLTFNQNSRPNKNIVTISLSPDNHLDQSNNLIKTTLSNIYYTFNFRTRSFNLIKPTFFNESTLICDKDLISKLAIDNVKFYSAEQLPGGDVIHRDILIIPNKDLEGIVIDSEVICTKFNHGQKEENYKFNFNPTASLRAVLNQMGIYPINWKEELESPYPSKKI